MGTPPDGLLHLIDRFSLGHRVFLSGDYKEEQLSEGLDKDGLDVTILLACDRTVLAEETPAGCSPKSIGGNS